MTDSFGVILHTPRKLLQDANKFFFPIRSNYIFMMVRREECIDINAYKWSVTFYHQSPNNAQPELGPKLPD